jgi:hypothetical protein
LTSVNGGADTPTASTLGILGHSGPFSVLPSANGIAVGAGDIGSLVSPFFFQDARRTFFVEPSLLETTTETWEEWIVPDPDPGISFSPHDFDDRIVVPWIPELVAPVGVEPDDPLLDPWNDLRAVQPHDIITSPDVAVLFDDTVLGSRGRVDLTVVSPRAGVEGEVAQLGARDLVGQTVISVVAGQVGESVTRDIGGSSGTRLVPDQVVLVDHNSLAGAGLSTESDHIKVIGGAGIGRSHVDVNALRGFVR